jgi:hypothetical protein
LSCPVAGSYSSTSDRELALAGLNAQVRPGGPDEGGQACFALRELLRTGHVENITSYSELVNP